MRVERFIRAAPQAIFDVLADPSQHPEIDGSGSVRHLRPGAPERLQLGSRFAMDMRITLPYRVTNTVVEFEEGKVIAWRHVGGHIWRYRLEPGQGGTHVTEEFDYRRSKAPFVLEALGYPSRHPPAMEKTLERLADLVS